jgi:hypothetical protein
MSVNGRTGEVRLANSLLLFEYQRDILGPSRTKSCCDGCESGTGTVRVEVRGPPCPLRLHRAGTGPPGQPKCASKSPFPASCSQCVRFK